MAAGEQKNCVVIAIDGSENAEYAVQWYLDNYHRKDNHVCLVTVPEFIHPNTMMSPGVVQDLMDKTDKEVEELKERFVSKFKALDASVEFTRLEGKVGEAIIDHVRKTNASCVVTGTRGQGKLRRTIMGSVSDYIVHHSPCPVLVCRHKDHHKEQQKDK